MEKSKFKLTDITGQPTLPASISASPSQKIKTLKFVTYDQMVSYASLGWIIHHDLMHDHHGEYGDIAEWPFETDPIFPE